jgi:NTP pyrophosphatase (non-canonical NTP hydrolase)
MQLAELSRRALEIRSCYAAIESARGGRPWTRSELAQGFAGDVGALMKLVMAKDGRRAGPSDLDARLAHELADCLWSVLVLAEACGVELEPAFLRTMDELEQKLAAGPGAKTVT